MDSGTLDMILEYLAKDQTRHTAKDISSALNLSETDVAKALHLLSELGLIEHRPDGSVRIDPQLEQIMREEMREENKKSTD